MRTRLLVPVIGVGLLLAAVPVWAHHAFAAEFDINRPLKLRGTVTKWEVTNPHSWIHIDVKGPDGKWSRGRSKAAARTLFTDSASRRSLLRPEPRSWSMGFRPRTFRI